MYISTSTKKETIEWSIPNEPRRLDSQIAFLSSFSRSISVFTMH